MVLFQLLVVILNKALDDSSGLGEHRRIELFLGLNAANRFVIDQKNTVQYAMFTHEVFIGRNVFFLFFFFLCGFLGSFLSGQGGEWHDERRTGYSRCSNKKI